MVSLLDSYNEILLNFVVVPKKVAELLTAAMVIKSEPYPMILL